MDKQSRTLALIKPDAFNRNLTGKIIDAALNQGLTIVAAKTVNLTLDKAESFYSIHADKPFFQSLISFMTSGTTVAIVFQGPDAVKTWRNTMGATNPKEANQGTIRNQFGESIEKNCTHGSDSTTNAEIEISKFFSDQELSN